MLLEALLWMLAGLALAPFLARGLRQLPGLNWQRTLRTLRPYRRPAERAVERAADALSAPHDAP
ncbi:hypothetical protein KGA65_06775 [Ideonella sp. B7]|uniref:hypothetical protein n=1 Tax=Ideonella benzenivorans TaxID=2831643 RepID=UPI001CEC501E|nr:hypothetical protein [Ideonella benzenivorans]MCA6216240.1 hypothetical protein [Ideonella benzenivorans]